MPSRYTLAWLAAAAALAGPQTTAPRITTDEAYALGTQAYLLDGRTEEVN